MFKTPLVKEFVIWILALVNLAEGVIHIVASAISFWGIYDTNAWDWRICTAPGIDLVLGITSLVTGIILGKWDHHHHLRAK
jgi:hypothetical protein